MERWQQSIVIENIKDKLPAFVRAWNDAAKTNQDAINKAAVDLALAIWVSIETDDEIKELLK